MITHEAELLRFTLVLANQKTLKQILIGNYGAILSTQKLLAALKYAEITLWSPLQSIGEAGEYISVL